MTLHDTQSDADVVEVEFAVADSEYPFVAIAQSEECEIVLEKLLPRADGRQAEYFSVSGTAPDRVVEFVDGHDAITARVLANGGERGLVEFVVGDGCPARFLAKRRAIPTRVEGTPGGGKIVAEVLAEDDPSEVVDEFVAEHDAELVAKRTQPKPTPLLSDSEIQTTILEELTDRQREVLERAHEAGYYRRPREQTGEEIAADLGISPTTFQEHVRAAERKIVTFLVEEQN